jgi:hypothetical protein
MVTATTYENNRLVKTKPNSLGVFSELLMFLLSKFLKYFNKICLSK